MTIDTRQDYSNHADDSMFPHYNAPSPPLTPPPPPSYPPPPPPPPPPLPSPEHQPYINLHKDTISLKRDEQFKDHWLVSFSFDALLDGSFTIYYFAKEGENSIVMPMNPNIYTPSTKIFRKGLGQKFCQSSGQGISLSLLDHNFLSRPSRDEVFPIVIHAEVHKTDTHDEKSHASLDSSTQIMFSVIESSEGAFKVKVVKQILSVDGERYELSEIFGLSGASSDDVEGELVGKECVTCIMEASDTTIMPRRHMGPFCLKCGVIGIQDYLVFCRSCKVHAEHRYCMDVIPEWTDEDVKWSCFQCCESSPKASSKPSSEAPLKNKKMKILKERSLSRQTSNCVEKKLNVAFGTPDDSLNESPKNSDRSVVSLMETEHGQKNLQPSLSSRLCPKESKHVEKGISAIHKLSAKDDVLGPVTTSKYVKKQLNVANDESPNNSDRKEVSRKEAKCGEGHLQPSQSSRLCLEESKLAGQSSDVLSSSKSLQFSVPAKSSLINDANPGNPSLEDVRVNFLVNVKDIMARSKKMHKTSTNQLSHRSQLDENNVSAVIEPVKDNLLGKEKSAKNKADNGKENEAVNGKDNDKEKSGRNRAHEISLNSAKNVVDKAAAKSTRRRRSLLNDDLDGDKDDTVRTPLEHYNLTDNIARAVSPTEGSKNKISQPIPACLQRAPKRFFPCPVWRGYFSVDGMEYGPIAAHSSRTICERAFNALQGLPSIFVLEKHPRSDIYPPSFHREEPTDHRVALYFFSGVPGVPNPFSQVVDDLMGYNQALRMPLGVADLLVFSSLILPAQSWLIENEYYLWGVVRKARPRQADSKVQAEEGKAELSHAR